MRVANPRVLPQYGSNAVKSEFDVVRHERCLDAHDAIAGAFESGIAARIMAAALTVIRAVDLDHEALRGSQEVCDEAA